MKKRVGSIEYFSKNEIGRDFVCGDIHGNLDSLNTAFKKVSFNKKRDRLFCCGDLVDRGSQNLEILDLLKENYFYSILGNHEVMFESTDPVYDKNNEYNIKINRSLHKDNGGEWIENINIDNSYYESVVDLPLAIQVEGENSSAFLTHSFVDGMSYKKLINILEGENNSFDILENNKLIIRTLWDTTVPNDVKILINESSDKYPLIKYQDCGDFYKLFIDKDLDLSGNFNLLTIDLCRRHKFKMIDAEKINLFVGHCIVQHHFYLDKPVNINNVYFMDTGSGMSGGYVSLLEIK